MRLVRVMEFGGPEVLVPGEAPAPATYTGQVSIDVAAVDTLFVETQVRAGKAPWFKVTPPYVPGWAVAGTVRSVDQYAGDRVGQRVAVRTPGGGAAECVVADVGTLVPVPDGLSLNDAAALLHDGPTALTLLDLAEVKPGEQVLVTAAAGGMGTLLVQLLHAAGAVVIGAARGKAKLDLVTSLGADAAVDYTEPGWTDQVGEVDVLLDGAGGAIGAAAFGLAGKGARVFHYGAPSGGFTEIDQGEVERRGLTVRGIEAVQLDDLTMREQTARAFAEAAAGRIKPVIGRIFPLERAAEAHAAIEAREVLGKALLVID